jgi:hypothetical protein
MVSCGPKSMALAEPANTTAAKIASAATSKRIDLEYVNIATPSETGLSLRDPWLCEPVSRRGCRYRDFMGALRRRTGRGASALRFFRPARNLSTPLGTCLSLWRVSWAFGRISRGVRPQDHDAFAPKTLAGIGDTRERASVLSDWTACGRALDACYCSPRTPAAAQSVLKPSWRIGQADLGSRVPYLRRPNPGWLLVGCAASSRMPNGKRALIQGRALIWVMRSA